LILLNNINNRKAYGKMKKKMVLSVKLIGIFEVVISLLVFFYAIGNAREKGLASILAALLFPLGAYFLIAGILILRSIAEGRVMSILICCFIYLISLFAIIRLKSFSLIDILIGIIMTGITLFIIYVLNLPKVKEQFRHD